MTVYREGKRSTYSVLSVIFSSGNLFLNFGVENVMSDELNMYL